MGLGFPQFVALRESRQGFTFIRTGGEGFFGNVAACQWVPFWAMRFEWLETFEADGI